MRINVWFKLLAIVFEHILINKTYYTIMVIKLTPSLEETTVQGIDMNVFSYWLLSYVLLPLHILTF